MIAIVRILRSALVLIFAMAGLAEGQVVSPFAGSELLGTAEMDFTRLRYLVPDDQGTGITSKTSEGRLISRILRRPAQTSNLEVFRSYQNELRAAGFDVLAALEDVRQVELRAREVNGPSGNNMRQRAYLLDGRPVGVLEKGRIETQAQQYIAARRTVGATELLVVVSTTRTDLYLIEELESAAMAANTVTLTLDALRGRMTDEGRVALYGIHFATGSAEIQASSAAALDTVIAYLRENPTQRFYVVGHTDDEGTLEHNMSLSSARAEAVVAALAARLPGAEARLEARGVGPLSPVATNGEANGRALNRRVELVSTHD